MSVNPEAVGDMPEDAADRMKNELNADRQASGSDRNDAERTADDTPTADGDTGPELPV